MEQRTYVVHATWDGDADVWVAESDDVPGLIAEAATPQALLSKLRVLVPELLELNGCAPEFGEVSLEVVGSYRQQERIHLSA
jgi:predicted RNase H-like HicB family nuclease